MVGNGVPGELTEDLAEQGEPVVYLMACASGEQEGEEKRSGGIRRNVPTPRPVGCEKERAIT